MQLPGEYSVNREKQLALAKQEWLANVSRVPAGQNVTPGTANLEVDVKASKCGQTAKANVLTNGSQ